MRVAVVGQGYVGLTGAVSLARQGHQVTGIEQDGARLRALLEGRAPISEPGLPEELALALRTRRLAFAPELADVHRAEPFDVVLITVGTPPAVGGSADLSQVTAAVAQAAQLVPLPLVVLKSTVPPGTSDRLLRAHPHLRQRYVYNPEFLNQGSALDDWAAPSRVIVGQWSPMRLPLLRRLYADMTCPWVVTTPATAEMTKYAANAFLAIKISFANEIARLCSTTEVNIDHVMRGVGLDPRIGHAFLQPGLGFGDSCLPKDTAALARWAADQGLLTPLLSAAIDVNRAQPGVVIDLLQAELSHALAHSDIAVLGVRYEPWSDDLRAAPSRTVIPRLRELAAEVRVWDPATSTDQLAQLFPGARPCPDLPATLQRARAVVILTEWPQVTEADWHALAHLLHPDAVIIDGKNCLPSERLTGLPLTYRSIGNRHPAHHPLPDPPDPPATPTAHTDLPTDDLE